MPYPTFHDRDGSIPVAEAVAGAIRAATQEEIVLAFFRQNPGEWTPAEVHEQGGMQAAPLTSTRRSITNLTARGLLVKTDNRREGEYGASNRTWRLATPAARNEDRSTKPQ